MIKVSTAPGFQMYQDCLVKVHIQRYSRLWDDEGMLTVERWEGEGQERNGGVEGPGSRGWQNPSVSGKGR